MYLVAIHVPIYLEGGRLSVSTDWHRSLILLRDSFEGRFGDICVLAPGRPAGQMTQQRLQRLDTEDGFQLNPVFREDPGKFRYWTVSRRRWLREVARHASVASVVHAGLDNIYRPLMYDAFRLSAQLRRPTVFVQDTDIAEQVLELASGLALWRRVQARMVSHLYERACRSGVALASLSLLKGQALMARYARHARNPKNFHDTSYTRAEIAPRQEVRARASSLSSGRPVRLVYFGRLVPRKGVLSSVNIVQRALAMGANIQFDVIGEGPDAPAIAELVSRPGLEGRVRLLEPQQYGPAFLRRLSTYDALLFTPSAEDTPRMIFDGYAAGLPLLARGIGYVKERIAEDRCGVEISSDPIQGARDLMTICANSAQLAALTEAAILAAESHSADRWYRLRAEWTIEAVERHQRGG